MHKVIEIITTYNELRDSYIKTLEENHLYTCFKRILVLTLKNGTIMNDKTCDELENYTLIEFPLNLIKHTFIKNELRVIKYDIFNKQKYKRIII